MEIRGVLGNFFQKNKNLAFQVKSEKVSGDQSLNSRPLNFDQILGAAAQAEKLTGHIAGQIMSDTFQGHALEADRALKVLSGEETGRLSAFRHEVLKDVVRQENRLAISSAAGMQNLRRFITG